MSLPASADELSVRVAELEERLASYERLLTNTPDLFYRTDMDGKITFISPSVYRLSGYTVEEAMGMKMAEEVYLNPEERSAFLRELKAHGSVFNFEAELVRKDRSTWFASTNAHWLTDDNGNIVGVEGITRDISTLKQTMSSLQMMEERFRLAFHINPDSININRISDGVYLDINEGFTELTGYTREEVIGRSSLEINIWNHPADRARLVKQLSSEGYVKNLEAEFVMKDGSVHVGLMSARILEVDNEQCILSITRTIEDLKAAEREKARLETELAQAHKMEAIGRLAGGIAHDLNNQLVPILGYSEMLLLDSDASTVSHKRLSAVVKAAEGARDMVQQLLAFSRKQTLAYQNVELNDLLREFKTLLHRTIREDVEIKLSLSASSARICADPGQIKQVIMNLVVNAADAMPSGGVVHIETSRATVEAQNIPYELKISPGSYVVVVVRDTGMGMDEAIRQQIFEPFFSTKGEQGTGLGLATVYGIVRQHNGDIYVSSELGRGATFTIFLPTAGQCESAAQRTAAERVARVGTETICLVEDNEMVRDLTREILETYGYRVLTADSGAAALKMLDKESDIDLLLTDIIMPGMNGRELKMLDKESDIDLLLTDIIMPGMNGRELYTALSTRFPQMKVLYMSGHSDDIISHQNDIDLDQSFIQKPFTADNMAAKIRSILDA
ncbi:MAG: PAS domain S-box protein [Deltaproteobacteria bacterium]|nr:PAS domain S-box protein [Deltaproteobacteria bacterium]MBN2673752.1 PAS domain S-box protein [Deltaproteobacteria bacterium]